MTVKAMTDATLERLDRYLENGDPVKDVDDELTLIVGLRERLRLAEAVVDWAEGAGDACWCQQANWHTETHLGRALAAYRNACGEK
jgi:hypothetical protein